MCWSGKWEDSKHIHSDAEPISGAGGWRRLESSVGATGRVRMQASIVVQDESSSAQESGWQELVGPTAL